MELTESETEYVVNCVKHVFNDHIVFQVSSLSSDFVTNRYGESWETMSPKLKMLGPLCNQTVNLKTDSKTLYYSTLKLKYSSSIVKHNKG